MAAETPYRLFDAHLVRRQSLSPSLSRLTFGGEDIAGMATAAPDQRIKIFLPDEAGHPAALPRDAGWYQAYKAVPPAMRPPMRTYTIRHLRHRQREIDIDFVLHGVNGPASRWALTARAGDPIQIAAPNRAFAGDVGGYEWKPPQGAADILIIADETALPAAAGILEDLARQPHPPHVAAYVEVPGQGDCVGLPQFDGLALTWLPRDGTATPTPEGALMAAAARRARVPVPAVRPGQGTTLRPLDPDDGIVWERADGAPHGGFYAWIAGEAEAVTQIRRTLIKERGLDKRAMNLMGYWRRGRVLDE